PVRRMERAANRADSATMIPLGDSAAIEAWRSQQEQRRAELEEQIAETDSTDSARLENLRNELKGLVEQPYPFPVTLGVRETEGELPTTHVLARGNPATPAETVAPSWPILFGGETPRITPVRQRGVASSGRRLALAEWVVQDAQQLSSRVIVNRLWHHMFGRGLAPMTSDLGRAGLPPTHPELIDWLAGDLLRHDWSLKSSLRRIALSRVYGRDFRPASRDIQQIDPANQWLSYRSVKRLDAEAVRDAMLAVSETLQSRQGGRGFFPELAGDIVAGGSRPGLGWSVSSDSERHRRSVYIFVKRSMRDPLIEAFDYGNTTSPLSERPVTTVAPQALILLNSAWTYDQAEALVASLPPADDWPTAAYLAALFERVLGRAPRQDELEILETFLARQTRLAAERLDELVIRPNAPKSLSVDYLRQLPPEMLIEPPAADWSAHRGVWGQGYEGIETVDPHAIPFVSWDAIRAEQGEWRMTWRCDPATERAAVLLSGEKDGERFRGLEVRYEPKASRYSIWNHRGESVLIAEADWTGRAIGPQRVTIRLDGARSSLHVSAVDDLNDDEIELTLPFDAGPGIGAMGGVTAWGAGIKIRDLEWQGLEDGAVAVRPRLIDEGRTREDQAQHMALVEVARLLFNTNEFVYVD
ncbi:MAG: DUF1553 domain-containing protein, partial [Planctomycetales bacterium]|nr:DUF1553 domain-containing protein [Planctomycetales bacterium]